MSNESVKKRKSTRNANGEGSVYYDEALKRYMKMEIYIIKNFTGKIIKICRNGKFWVCR